MQKDARSIESGISDGVFEGSEIALGNWNIHKAGGR